jgi:hypothetical protein
LPQITPVPGGSVFRFWVKLHADPKKGITVFRSFGKRITEYPELEQALASYVARAGEKLRRESLLSKHMLVFMHTSPFRRTRQRTRITRQAAGEAKIKLDN